MVTVALAVVGGATGARAAQRLPCPDGRFLVVEGGLVGGSDEVVVLETGTLATTTGCPPVRVRLKPRPDGTTRVRARWGRKTPCAGLDGPAALKAAVVEECGRLTGTLVARKATPRERPFAAQRSFCGDGLVDAGRGEECDGGSAAACATTCRLDCTCTPQLQGLFAVTDTNVLVGFRASAPQTLTSTALITGLGVGERIEGIDFRPATGQLVGLGISAGGTDVARLYVLDPLTGAATAVSAAVALGLPTSPYYGIDFNPVVDRLRVVSTADENARFNPDTGERLDAPLGDTDLTPSRQVAAIAYDRNVATAPGAGSTTLFGITATLDVLVRIGGVDGLPSPNLGQVTTIGPLGVDVASADIGFDIDGKTGTAFATLRPFTNLTGLYTIDLATGAATFAGLVADGSVHLPGLAVAPGGP